jgi:NADPH-dependent 2,4-dienoyl-CoA reductase/sulfur reductase-like enzyme
MDTEEGFNLFRARAIRETVGVPVIGVGRISRPERAEEAISAGDADLISFGRQHLTDPDFLAKAREGRFEEIRWCVACNQGCIERLGFEMKSAACSFNPECGREFQGEPLPAPEGKRLWVIGAGPAGLSAALAAAGRGYAVELFEKEEAPGGQVRPASRPPRKQAYLDWVDWAVRRLEKRGAAFHFDTEMTGAQLKDGRPDAVILAAGASPVTPEIPGLSLPHVVDARDLLMGKARAEGPAVILGAGHVGMETADFLAARGLGATLLEMQPFLPVGKHTARGYWLHRRLREAGGRILLGATAMRIETDAVVFRQAEEGKRIPAASVVTAMGARPDNALEETLRETGIPCRVVGDAKSPRRLIEAIHEGDRAGREI